MKIENRQKLLVIVTIVAGVYFIGDYFVLTPLVKFWRSRAEAISSLRKQVADGEDIRAQADSIQLKWNRLRTNSLPESTSAAEQRVFKAFDSWSRQSSVTLLSVTPQWKRDADDHITLECRVEAGGNLSALTRFLYEVEKDPMALRMTGVELSARDAEGQEMTLGLHVSGLVLPGENP